MAPRKANQPQLTRDQIIPTALSLIDEFGLAALSIRRLGAALRVDPSTIYYYVPSKAALFDLVVDEVLSGVDTSCALKARGFEQRVLAAGRAYREALLRHPHIMPLVAVRPLRTPVQLRMIDAFARLFLDAEFSEVETLIALDVTGITVLGLTNMHAAEVTRPEYTERTSVDGDGAVEAFAPDEFPHLVRLLPYAAVVDADLEFDRAMRALAVGLLAQHCEGRLAPTRREGQAAARRRRARQASRPALPPAAGAAEGTSP